MKKFIFCLLLAGLGAAPALFGNCTEGNCKCKCCMDTTCCKKCYKKGTTCKCGHDASQHNTTCGKKKSCRCPKGNCTCDKKKSCGCSCTK